MSNSLQNKRILIVDDEEVLCEIMGDELTMMGCEVVVRYNLRSAIEALEKEAPFDVLVSDVRMPGGGGAQLLDHVITHLGQKPRVLFVTGLSDIAPDEAYERGVVAILMKPFALEDLSAAVLKSLAEPVELALSKTSPAPTKIKVQLESANLQTAIEEGLLSVARGGLFIHSRDQFPKFGERVSFRVDFKDGGLKSLEGTGICLWARREPMDQLPTGYAIEFESLHPDSANLIKEVLRSSPSNSYLPRR